MSLVEIVILGDEHNGLMPEVLLGKVLIETLDDVHRFSYVHVVRSILILAHQQVDACVGQVRPVSAVLNLDARNLVGLARPVGQLTGHAPIGVSVDEEDADGLSECHRPKIRYNVVYCNHWRRLWELPIPLVDDVRPVSERDEA